MIRILVFLTLASLLFLASVKQVSGVVKVDVPVLFHGVVHYAKGNYTQITDGYYILQRGEFNVTGYLIAPLAVAMR